MTNFQSSPPIDIREVSELLELASAADEGDIAGTILRRLQYRSLLDSSRRLGTADPELARIRVSRSSRLVQSVVERSSPHIFVPVGDQGTGNRLQGGVLARGDVISLVVRIAMLGAPSPGRRAEEDLRSTEIARRLVNMSDEALRLIVRCCGTFEIACIRTSTNSPIPTVLSSRFEDWLDEHSVSSIRPIRLDDRTLIESTSKIKRAARMGIGIDEISHIVGTSRIGGTIRRAGDDLFYVALARLGTTLDECDDFEPIWADIISRLID